MLGKSFHSPYRRRAEATVQVCPTARSTLEYESNVSDTPDDFEASADDPFGRRRHAPVAAVARSGTKAVHAAAGRRNAAGEDSKPGVRARRCRRAVDGYQP